jgi:hypothetical protein
VRRSYHVEDVTKYVNPFRVTHVQTVEHRIVSAYRDYGQRATIRVAALAYVTLEDTERGDNRITHFTLSLQCIQQRGAELAAALV